MSNTQKRINKLYKVKVLEFVHNRLNYKPNQCLPKNSSIYPSIVYQQTQV